MRKIKHILANMDKLKGQYEALMKCSKRTTRIDWDRIIKVANQCRIFDANKEYKNLQPGHAMWIDRLASHHTWQSWVNRCEEYGWSIKTLKEKIEAANLDGAIGKARQRDFKKWVTLYQEQMENLLPQLSELDAIITDPPYGRDYIAILRYLLSIP